MSFWRLTGPGMPAITCRATPSRAMCWAHPVVTTGVEAHLRDDPMGIGGLVVQRLLGDRVRDVRVTFGIAAGRCGAGGRAVDNVNSAGGGATSGAEGRRIAYAAMRRVIAAGDLMPAQRLVERDLADAYGVTRSSIRAALLRLSSEGLVERVPNRGSRVRVVTVEEAVDITEVRMQLEGLLAAKAAGRVTPETAAELRSIGTAM